MAKTKQVEKPFVVVTTEHRGVFFGKLESRDGNEVTLSAARVCVYWSAETKGFIGLAVTGPLKGSKVSLAADELTVTAVTSITKCTEAAVAQWLQGLWG